MELYQKGYCVYLILHKLYNKFEFYAHLIIDVRNGTIENTAHFI